MKELLHTSIRSFFVIATGVVVSFGIFCAILDPDAVFGIDVFGKIIGMALAGTLPFIAFYSRKELNRKQVMVRRILHLFLLLGILLCLAAVWELVDFGSIIEVAVFIGLVLGVYAIIVIGITYRDRKMADELNVHLWQQYRGQEDEEPENEELENEEQIN